MRTKQQQRRLGAAEPGRRSAVRPAARSARDRNSKASSRDVVLGGNWRSCRRDGAVDRLKRSASLEKAPDSFSAILRSRRRHVTRFAAFWPGTPQAPTDVLNFLKRQFVCLTQLEQQWIEADQSAHSFIPSSLHLSHTPPHTQSSQMATSL